MSALVSVLMPAYNHERFLETAIRSVMEQNWPRIELLVVDDGSRDGTWDVLCRLRTECEHRFERVVMAMRPNEGTCATMNQLCAQAEGTFVTVLASDDAFLPGAFGALIAPLEADPLVGVAVGRNELMDDDGRRCCWDAARRVVYGREQAKYLFFDEFLREATGVDAFGPKFGDYGELVRMNHIGNGAMLRKSVLDKVLPFTKEAPLEDWWMHLQLAKLTRYRMVGDRTFRYRWHEGNSIRQNERMARFYRETLIWEERHVESLDNRRWRDAFAAAHWDVRRKVGFGRALTFDKVVTLREIRRVLTIFGRGFVLHRQVQI